MLMRPMIGLGGMTTIANSLTPVTIAVSMQQITYQPFRR
jgi:hypothetical protein